MGHRTNSSAARTQPMGCKSATTDLSASRGAVERPDHQCGDDLVVCAVGMVGLETAMERIGLRWNRQHSAAFDRNLDARHSALQQVHSLRTLDGFLITTRRRAHRRRRSSRRNASFNDALVLRLEKPQRQKYFHLFLGRRCGSR